MTNILLHYLFIFINNEVTTGPLKAFIGDDLPIYKYRFIYKTKNKEFTFDIQFDIALHLQSVNYIVYKCNECIKLYKEKVGDFDLKNNTITCIIHVQIV